MHWARRCAGQGLKDHSAESLGISWLPPLNVSAPAETAEGRVLPLFPLGGVLANSESAFAVSA